MYILCVADQMLDGIVLDVDVDVGQMLAQCKLMLYQAETDFLQQNLAKFKLTIMSHKNCWYQ